MRPENRTLTVSHQNVRLARGRHSSPEQGACVVELASMLAGERFSDHPRSVCPVIASYLRSVNDLIPAEDLPELYPLAAAIVGSRGSRRERRARVRECARWASSLGVADGIVSIWLGRRWGWGRAEVGSLCARAAIGRGGPDLALSLLEALLAQRPAPAEPRLASSAAAPAAGQVLSAAGQAHDGLPTPSRRHG